MQEKFLLGTYTRKTSKGIYEGTLEDEKLTVNFLLPESNPTYLTTSKKNILYTVGADDNGGGIVSYDLNHKEKINSVTFPGSAPCYVAVDEKRQLVYSGNYHKGSLLSYKILSDGSLKAADKVTHTGSGPHKNQEKAHVHYSDLAPDGRLIVCDLGTDGLYTYDVSPEGKLTEIALFKAVPGTGPRHLVFHPEKNMAYLIGELANTVTVLSYFPDGHFESLQTLSTLPEDFSEESSGGAIKITRDGKFLYASNRGHNSLACYHVEKDGLLTLVEITSSHGDFPRDFSLNSTDEYLICTHQKSDHLSLFKKEANGKLTFISNDTLAPEAVCVKF